MRLPSNKHRGLEPRRSQDTGLVFVLLFAGPVRFFQVETRESVRVALVLL
jgi:hypothetical protein